MSAALSRDPAQQLRRSPGLPLYARLFGMLHRGKIGRKGFIPPPFRVVMGRTDPRLPEQTQGLGVAHAGRARFFPLATLRQGVELAWDGATLTVAIDPLDGVPSATWADNTRPFQIFSRWYGFSLTYPDCELQPSP